MKTIINTFENISDIALAFFDEREEVLKEITEENLYFAVPSFSTQHKRLYLIGDMIYNNTVNVVANIEEGYEVKLIVKDSFDSLDDFNDATNTVSCTFSHSYLNSIPVDILIISNKAVLNTINLSITITTGA